jgi:Double-GTPase 2
MSGSCTYVGCTVDVTGVCALERDIAVCENRMSSEVKAANTVELRVGETAVEIANLDSSVLAQPKQGSRLLSSQSLDLESLTQMMGKKYVNLIGILGEPESGKTACLASLYLLVAHSKLKGWSFADSESLFAFEDIARGARVWNNGQPPANMTTRTELANERNPGFLHLKLVRDSDGRSFDLALPDLPGEWTQALIETANADRFEFLKSTDCLWIVLDGRTLADDEKRNSLLLRIGQLAGRLKTIFASNVWQAIIVVTHDDVYPITESVRARLDRELKNKGLTAQIVSVAPFSERLETVCPGSGISELINLTIASSSLRSSFWSTNIPNDDDRAYLSYRRQA